LFLEFLLADAWAGKLGRLSQFEQFRLHSPKTGLVQGIGGQPAGLGLKKIL